MFDIIRARIKQGYRTMPFPKKAPAMPDRFRGLPRIDAARCPQGCGECASVCPFGAIEIGEKGVRIDLGRCLFCAECSRACKHGAIEFTNEYRLAASERKSLFVSAASPKVEAMGRAMARIFGRSLKLREVSAGGCNACEADVNVLSTLAYDMGRFGIQFVASPRHADGILVTGPVTQNMRLALEKTYAAVPAPKIVIASGACAISGGPYIGHSEQCDGVLSLLPVDLFIPGCPPHPLTTLDGLLRLLGRIESDRQKP
ncbi:MAG: 4Fe-4S dicluster domain-containing protein [bacterium]